MTPHEEDGNDENDELANLDLGDVNPETKNIIKPDLQNGGVYVNTHTDTEYIISPNDALLAADSIISGDEIEDFDEGEIYAMDKDAERLRKAVKIVESECENQNREAFTDFVY